MYSGWTDGEIGEESVHSNGAEGPHGERQDRPATIPCA